MTDIDYEIQYIFQTAYRGTCAVNRAHQVKPGDKVAILRRADNPLLPVSGVACERCWRGLEHFKG